MNPPKIPSAGFDPVCLIHGKKMSEHECIYCCMCFKSLTLEECHLLPNGKREDCCNECAREEEQMIRQRLIRVLRKRGVLLFLQIPVAEKVIEITCRRCGFTDEIAMWRATASMWTDCACPKCGSTDNAHNDEYRKRIHEGFTKSEEGKASPLVPGARCDAPVDE